MSSPLLPENDSPYRKFARDPNDDYDGDGEPFRTPMTMIDQDGSILYENEDFRLLWEIIWKNDAKSLEQYLTIAPSAVPMAPTLYESPSESWDSDYFQLAAESGGLAVLQVLLARCTKDKDPSIQIRFKARGFELLNEAAKWGHVDIVQFLLDSQPLYSSIHERDPNGYTAMASAADFYSTQVLASPTNEEVCPAKNEAVMNLLLDRGACASDVVISRIDKARTSDTVLTLAAQWAGPELIKRLIDGGADVHAKVSRDPWDLGLSIDHLDHHYIYDIEALFVACERANLEAIKTLIEHRGVGVDIRDMICSRDSFGSPPLHWATRNRLLEDLGYIPTSAFHARMQNITKVIDLLLDIDPSTINVQDNHGNTALHYATQYLSHEDKRFVTITELLCNRGADASIRNNKGETPIHTLVRHCASIEFDAAIISILLSHGAKATDVDDAGNTPLHIAAEYLHLLDAVSLLLERGADASIRNDRQDTPLHIAARGGRWKNGHNLAVNERIKLQDNTLQRIVEAGGSILMDLPNAEGKSPREICQEQRHKWRQADSSSRGQGRGRGWGRGAARIN